MRQVLSLLVAVVVVVVVMPAYVLAAPPVIQKVSGLLVKDAEGKNVGTVVGTDGSNVMIALRIAGQGFLLAVTSTQTIALFTAGFFLYESTDCTGTPMFTASDPAALVPAATVAPPGLTVWVADPTATPQQIVPRSTFFTDECRPPFLTPTAIPLVPAIPLVNLLDHFTPPFRVKFKR